MIHGENYPPPPYAMFLVTVMGYVQIGVFLLMVSGRFVFGLVGVEPPGWFESLMSNKVRVCVFVWVGGCGWMGGCGCKGYVQTG